MSRGNEYRAPRRRGFDDDNYSPPSYGQRDARPPARSYGSGSSQAAPTGPVVEATVKWFNPEKGFGFVELLDGSGDAFLHINTLQNAGHESVAPGAKLRIQVGQGMKGAQVMSVLEVDSSAAVQSAPRSSAPRGERSARPAVDHSTATEVHGVVKWFNPDKGFGFVTCSDGRKDVFVHASVVEAAGLGSLAEGQALAMRVVETPKGREAVSLTIER
jgi:CspA family cold shock protein